MDYYTLLKFFHIIGFTLLGGGLLAVFVSEFQAYRTNDMKEFAESSKYTAIFYDYLVIPGALTVGTTGFFLGSGPINFMDSQIVRVMIHSL